MPISHVSELIKSSPWIQPFSIDLMEKVNSYKQGEFYRNAAKTENMITQLNNADIANPDQRAYLKSKVSNLTTQVNNMGGINYSDMNIANTLEGFGAEIYGDEKVLNGIASTKSIREWQNNVQKLKTDPKLSKYYNAANEAYDYEHHIKPYVSGGIDAKYEGPRSPKPYTGNPFTKMMEQMKTLRPDIETRIDPVTGNSFFFNKKEQRILKPEDITAALDGFIDGDTKAQLQIDAWYNYDYSTGNRFDKQTGVDIYTQDLDNAIDNKNAELKKVDEQIAAEPDVAKKAEWEKYKTDVAAQLADYNTNRAEMVNDFGKSWDKDPQAAKYKLYMNRFQKDIGKAAGFHEEKNTLVNNQERMFQARAQLEYMKKGLYWDGVHYNADGTPLVQPVKGAETMNSSSTKTGKKEPYDVSNGIFHDITQNTETNSEAQKHKVTEESLLKDNDQIDVDQTSKLRKFLIDVANHGGYDQLLGLRKTAESNPGAAPTITTSPLLEQIQNIGDKSLLTRSDIQYVLNKVEERAKQAPAGREYTNYLIRDDKNQEIGLTKEQVGFFKNVMKNWDAVATGKLKSNEVSMDISVSDLSGFVNEYQTLDLIKKSNTGYINLVKSQALEGSGLNSQQLERYKYFIGHPDEQKIPAGADRFGETQYTDNPEWFALKKASKIEYRTIDRNVKNAFNNAGDRLNYYSLYLPDVETLQKVAPGLMEKIRLNATTQNTKKVVGVSISGSIENLKPARIHRTVDGKFMIDYTAGPDKNPVAGSVEVSADEAQTLGAQLYPNEPLEKLMQYETNSGDLYTYSPVFKQPIKYHIKRETNSRNQRVFVPYIEYNGQNIPVYAPDKKGFQGSANAAETLLKQYITNNTAENVEQFIAGLQLLRNQ